ncbi:hypothetical protein [Macrococcus equi]|uniref:hypothetical protein n=1 Tax=Macrococcus equi TaxID=3395462 RepID=UPI0039BE98E5
MDGEHFIFRNNDDIGLSVIKNNYSYGNELGLYEVAPLVFGDDDSTQIDGDVEGWVSIDDILKRLDEL